MSNQVIIHKVLGDALDRRFPYILFAILHHADGDNCEKSDRHRILAVYLTPGTSQWRALEEILSLLHELTMVDIDVVLLNHTDPETRFHASGGNCVLLRDRARDLYSRFAAQSSLDCRLLRAQLRRKGITGTHGVHRG
jgi:hypothetical protein